MNKLLFQSGVLTKFDELCSIEEVQGEGVLNLHQQLILCIKDIGLKQHYIYLIPISLFWRVGDC